MKMKMKMKVMKKDIVTIVGFFSKISHYLKRTLKITLGGIIHSGGVKIKKFQLVSKKFNWQSGVQNETNNILQN